MVERGQRVISKWDAVLAAQRAQADRITDLKKQSVDSLRTSAILIYIRLQKKEAMHAAS